MLDEKVSIGDLEDVDPDLAKNLVWLLENDIGDGVDLGMDFRFLIIDKFFETFINILKNLH